MANNNKKKPFNPPWIVTIALLAWCLPVGLYFLWSKIRYLDIVQDKSPGNGASTGGIAMMIGALVLGAWGQLSGFWAVSLGIGGAALLAFDSTTKKQRKRFHHYRAVIGAHPTMSIHAIASAVGVDHDTAMRDLKKMIEEQFFGPEAYIDIGAGIFVSNEKAGQYAAAAHSRPSPARPTTAQNAQQTATAQPTASAATQGADDMSESEYVRKLTEIRKLNDAIKDEKVSAQIDRIEQITANIFECVVERPNKRGEIKVFMNYYLPTTLKLLTAYSRLERQNISGDNIDASKRNIEKMLDQLVWAFERQNDQMFAHDALDISSDIKVMETMLAKDGLSEGGLPKHPFAAAVQRKPG